MDLRELERLLRAEGVRDDAYALGGGLPAEAYCIDRDGAEWVVYYSERGVRTGLRRFSSESAACQYLLNELRDDPSTRR